MDNIIIVFDREVMFCASCGAVYACIAASARLAILSCGPRNTHATAIIHMCTHAPKQKNYTFITYTSMTSVASVLEMLKSRGGGCKVYSGGGLAERSFHRKSQYFTPFFASEYVDEAAAAPCRLHTSLLFVCVPKRVGYNLCS